MEPTSTPISAPADSPSVELVDYVIEVYAYNEVALDLSAALLDSSQAALLDPALLADPTWTSDVTITGQLILEIGTDFSAAPVPPDGQALSDVANDAIAECNAGVGSVQKALDAQNNATLSDAVAQFESCREYIAASQDLLAQMGFE